MIFKYKIEIEIDEENISQKYPNYNINYSNSKELADSIAFGLEQAGGTNMAEDGLEEWGYSIKVENISNR